MADIPDRDKYIADWAKQLGVQNNPWYIVQHLVSKVKNYDSAVALMFGLSWIRDRDYLNRAAKTLSDWHKAAGAAAITPNDLYQFMTYYVENIEKAPE